MTDRIPFPTSRLMDLLRRPRTTEEIARALRLSPASVGAVLQRMAQRGEIRREEKRHGYQIWAGAK